MMKYSAQKNSGFSLVETLVAITVLLLLIVGPMAISSQTAQSTSFSSEQIQAFLLAQEGIEIVERMRDDYALEFYKTGNTNYWSGFTDDTTSGPYQDCFLTQNNGRGCGVQIDSDGVKVVACGGSTDPCVVGIDRNAIGGDQFVHKDKFGSPPGSTIFTRTVKLTSIAAAGDAPAQVHAVVTVSWRTGALREAQEVTLETYLLKLYE